MNASTDTTASLSNNQKKALRGMGHHLLPVVYAGKEGFTPPFLKSLAAALQVHELIKIKIGQNCPVERNQAGDELARLAGAVLVQIIGRMILLYRPNPDRPEGQRIVLP